MYGSDEDVIPCDDDGKYLTTAVLQEDDASSHHLDSPALNDSSVSLEGSDSTEDSADCLPPAVQNNLSSLPPKVQQWANLQGDSDSDIAPIASMYDGAHEPKTYAQALKCSDFQNWWGSMCIGFKTMEDKQVWVITPKAYITKGRKIVGS
jgi:hypothetical protein